MGANQDKLKEYDEEPVEYCKNCYSLKIRYEEITDSDCCMECGCSDIATATIDEWERMYERRYGKKFVDRKVNIRNTPIFNLPLSKLKMKVHDHPMWRTIIKRMYPRFPGGLSRADSVILFFNKLIEDNNLDNLRLLLLREF